jgi:hypothetical protein
MNNGYIINLTREISTILIVLFKTMGMEGEINEKNSQIDHRTYR